MKLSTISISVILASALIWNQQGWASNTIQPPAETQKSQEIQSTIKAISTQIQERTSQNKSASPHFLMQGVKGMIIARSIIILSNIDMKNTLQALVIPQTHTVNIGIDSDVLATLEKNPEKMDQLKQVLKEAAQSGHLPHIYLVGKITPDAVDDIVNLSTQQKVVYEPLNAPLNLVLNSVNRFVKPGQRINIAIVSLADINSHEADLDQKILQALPQVNFMASNGDSIHIQQVGNTLKMTHYNRAGKEVLTRTEAISSDHPVIVDRARTVVKSYEHEHSDIRHSVRHIEKMAQHENPIAQQAQMPVASQPPINATAPENNIDTHPDHDTPHRAHAR